jgi:hypothetical protein
MPMAITFKKPEKLELYLILKDAFEVEQEV